MIEPVERDRLGVVLVFASACAFSTAGLFARIIPLDTWTVLFWRGLFGGAFIAGYVVMRHRRDTLAVLRRTGRFGLLAAACSGVATICFINALRLTSVADVMVIGATAPFVTAAMTWLWLGRRESATTLAASVVALAGVAVMFNAGMPAAHLLGSVLALAMTVLMSGMMVIIRHKRDTPMLPAASLSAFLCAALVLPVAAPGRVGWHDLIWLAVFGMAQFGLGLLLMTLGTGMISATRSALICTLDTPLAPVWVWLAVGERPSLPTCIGGAIVMAAVLADIVLRKPPSAPSAEDRPGPQSPTDASAARH